MILFSLLTQLAFAEDREVRIAEGIITDSQPGDIACYLSIQAKDGTMHHPMAYFDLCAPIYIDKHSTFSWEKVNVLAADCEGDVDCGRSDSKWLISMAQVKWSASIQDNENGTSVLSVQSGRHSHKIAVPLGGCVKEEKADGFFFTRACYFAGAGGSISLKQTDTKGLQALLSINDEKGTTTSVLWTEPRQAP